MPGPTAGAWTDLGLQRRAGRSRPASGQEQNSQRDKVQNLPLPHSPHLLLSTVNNNSYHLLGAYCLPYTVMMHVHYLLSAKSILSNGCYYPHVSDKAVEIQRGYMSCPRSPHGSEAEPGFTHRAPLALVPRADPRCCSPHPEGW